MTRTAATLSLATAAALLTAVPAHAVPPESRTCQPTFDAVTGLAAAVDYLEDGWGRPLTPDELVMAQVVFEKVDVNDDNLICIKIASAVPAPSDPVPQAMDNHFPRER